LDPPRKNNARANDFFILKSGNQPCVLVECGFITNSAEEALLKQSDYLCLCCPLTEDTRGILGEPELKSMKKTAFLVNVSRGGVVKEHALVRALKEGWIEGAALDVFEKEPIANTNPLRKLENVILTPHAGSYSVQSYQLLRRTVVEQAVQILKGEWPLNLYNPEIKDKLCIETLWNDAKANCCSKSRR